MRPPRSPLRTRTVDDPPVPVDGPVDASPRPGHQHVGSIGEQIAAPPVAALPGRAEMIRCRSLNPPEQGHVSDIDAASGDECIMVYT